MLYSYLLLLLTLVLLTVKLFARSDPPALLSLSLLTLTGMNYCSGWLVLSQLVPARSSLSTLIPQEKFSRLYFLTQTTGGVCVHMRGNQDEEIMLMLICCDICATAVCLVSAAGINGSLSGNCAVHVSVCFSHLLSI